MKKRIITIFEESPAAFDDAVNEAFCCLSRAKPKIIKMDTVQNGLYCVIEYNAEKRADR